ncbi:hypothetical protein CYY_000702 [Polysphondylium violaceum]|uniref:Protein kinase domain-containing protein n=1 Tax=Polysphondylium violaceum TaxID=133409 RepID=A0A8J4Q104_9MYCE|nr:hypothetical protein CYY_000702 [Polysphondylium violaceum]
MNSVFTFNQKQYKLVNSIGAGEFANVHLAVCLQDGQQVAVKKYKSSSSNTEVSRNTIKNLECEILRYMSTQPYHDNIVRFLGFLDENSLLFEYCEKGEFTKYLGRINKEQTEELMREAFVQWISGLHFLQTRDRAVVHRDIKLANIIVQRRYGKDIFKIADFGFASNKHSSDEMYKSLYGTPRNTAPEIRNQESYGISADIYSIGRCLYDVLAVCPEQIGDPQFNPLYVRERSTDYQDLITRMMDCKENRITVNDIIKHPWITSKTISIKLFGKSLKTKRDTITVDQLTKFFYNITTVNEFSDYIGIDLNNNILLCSYEGREGINTLQDNIFYPIYTIKSIIIISKNFKPTFQNFSLEPLVFYTKNNQDNLENDSKDNTLDIINNVLSILEYLIDLYDGYSIFKFIRNFIHDFRNVDSKVNIEKFIQNLSCYKSSIEVIKNLKEIDHQGNETNNLVFDSFPLLLKSLISSTNMAKVQDLLSSMDHILSIDYKELDKLFIELLDKFDVVERLSDLQQIKETFLKKVTVLRDPEQDAVLNDIIGGVIDIYSKFIKKDITTSTKLCLNTQFFMKVYLDIDQVNKFTLITCLKEIDMYKEISKIPDLYQIYRNEVKRRNIFNSEFKKLTLAYQKKLYYINQLEKKHCKSIDNNNNINEQEDDEQLLNDFILIGDNDAIIIKLKKENVELMNHIETKRKEMESFQQIYPFKYLYQLLDIAIYQDLDSIQYQTNSEMRMLAAQQLSQIREIEQSYIQLYDSSNHNKLASEIILDTIQKETIDNRVALESFIQFNNLDISTREKQEKLDQLKKNVAEKKSQLATVTQENHRELHRFKLQIDQEQSNLSKMIRDKQERLTFIKQQLASINLDNQNQEFVQQKEKIKALEEQILKLTNTIQPNH